jgi:hypothetical protein
MVETLEILKYILPSGIVFITAFFMIKMFLNAQEEIKKRELQTQIEQLRLQIKQEDKKHLTPIRMQAYERMVLFLERISPSSMIFRIQKPGQKAFQLQSLMLKSIRDEYEHNLAQQLYISKESWTMLKTAKEDIIKSINNAAAEINPNDSGLELSKKIFELSIGTEKQNSDRAIDMLKKDIHKLF